MVPPMARTSQLEVPTRPAHQRRPTFPLSWLSLLAHPAQALSPAWLPRAARPGQAPPPRDQNTAVTTKSMTMLDGPDWR